MMTFRAISINKGKYDEPLGIPTDPFSAVKIELYLLPTDIPRDVYGIKSKDGNTFTIQFKYLNEEKEHLLFGKNNVRFYVGSKSGKPMRIQIINIVKENINHIRLKNIIVDDVRKALAKKFQEEKLTRKKSNFKITSEVLEQNSDKLVAAID